MSSVYRKGKSYMLAIGKRDSRRAVGIGRITSALAKQVKHHVDEILAMRGTTTNIPSATQSWLDGIDDELYASLNRLGLVPLRAGRGDVTLTIGRMFDLYIGRRKDLSDRSIINIKAARSSMVDHFGVRSVRSIQPAECADWRRRLMAKYAPPTVAGMVKKSRQVFKDASMRGLIERDPMAGVKAGSQKNRSRIVFVDRATIKRVIDETPDAETRLAIKLARFGGLRVPSELAVLTWDSILWDKKRIAIYSPKTKSTRIIPLFPELFPELQDVFDAAEIGEKKVLPRMSRDKNLRTRFQKIIIRAGVMPWAKLFHNLRASRQTELAATFPIHVVCEWIGNSEAIAKDHYLSVTEENFDRATGSAIGSATVAPDVIGRAGRAKEGKENDWKYDNSLEISAMPIPPRGLESKHNVRPIRAKRRDR